MSLNIILSQTHSLSKLIVVPDLRSLTRSTEEKQLNVVLIFSRGPRKQQNIQELNRDEESPTFIGLYCEPHILVWTFDTGRI